MSARNDGGPAFPSKNQLVDEIEYVCCEGMSLRDYFAGQALAGLLAVPDTGNWKFEEFSSAAYQHADAMLEARQR